MVVEIKVMKVYVDQCMFRMYCPFPILQMPATEYHMKKIYSGARKNRFWDYSQLITPSEVLIIPSLEDSSKCLDDIAEWNVDNMMEGQGATCNITHLDELNIAHLLQNEALFGFFFLSMRNRLVNMWVPVRTFVVVL